MTRACTHKRMSALPPKATLEVSRVMSALWQKRTFVFVQATCAFTPTRTASASRLLALTEKSPFIFD